MCAHTRAQRGGPLLYYLVCFADLDSREPGICQLRQQNTSKQHGSALARQSLIWASFPLIDGHAKEGDLNSGTAVQTSSAAVRANPGGSGVRVMIEVKKPRKVIDDSDAARDGDFPRRGKVAARR